MFKSLAPGAIGVKADLLQSIAYARESGFQGLDVGSNALKDEVEKSDADQVKGMFAEAGLPDRVPRDWDEMLEWGKRLTEPSERRYGLKVYNAITGWQYLMFLYSMGG